MQRKRTLSLVLAIAMAISFIPVSVFAADYNDTSAHWASAEISKWSDLGILQGDNGAFRPDSSMTRAEFATIMDRLMGYQAKAENTFTDLPIDWYTDAMLRANAAGVFLGSDGKITPTEKISREQAAIVMCRAFGIAPIDGATSFADDADIASWAKGYVKAAVAAGFFIGVGDNNFAPKQDITRASVVKMLDNAIQGFINTTEKQTGIINGNVIVNKPGAVLKDMTINGTLIIAEGVGDGDVTLDSVIVTGGTIVRGGGANSIYVTGDSDLGTLTISKKDAGMISVKVTGNALVSVIIAENGTIGISGNIGNLDITGDVTVLLVGATIETVNIDSPAKVSVDKTSMITTVNVTPEAENTAIDTEAGAKIANINAAALGTTVSGNGDVTSVTATANDVVVTTPGTEVEAAEGTTGVLAGDSEVPSGTSGTTDGGETDPVVVPPSVDDPYTPPRPRVAVMSVATPTKDGEGGTNNIGKYSASLSGNTATLNITAELVSFNSADPAQGAGYWVGALITLDKDITEASYKTASMSAWEPFTQADVQEAVNGGATGTKTFVWWFKAEDFTADKAMQLKVTSASDSTAITLVAKIDKMDVAASDYTITGIASSPFTGSPRAATITPKLAKAVGAVSNIKYAGSTAEPVNAGTYAVSFDAAETASYKGATGLSGGNLVIAAKALTNTAIGAIADQEYTGDAVKPTITVTDGGTTLVEGTDYVIDGYSNNISPGTATVHVTFTDNYSGTADKTFTILYIGILDMTDSYTLVIATPGTSGSARIGVLADAGKVQIAYYTVATGLSGRSAPLEFEWSELGLPGEAYEYLGATFIFDISDPSDPVLTNTPQKSCFFLDASDPIYTLGATSITFNTDGRDFEFKYAELQWGMIRPNRLLNEGGKYVPGWNDRSVKADSSVVTFNYGQTVFLRCELYAKDMVCTTAQSQDFSPSIKTGAAVLESMGFTIKEGEDYYNTFTSSAVVLYQKYKILNGDTTITLNGEYDTATLAALAGETDLTAATIIAEVTADFNANIISAEKKITINRDPEVNGRLDTADLTRVASAWGKAYLHKDMAVAWSLLVNKAIDDLHETAAGSAAIMVLFELTGANSGYRTFEKQQEFWDDYQNGTGNIAAYPGTSNHGYGAAIDFGLSASSPTANATTDARKVWNWMYGTDGSDGNAADFGYYNYPPEPWHWSNTGG